MSDSGEEERPRQQGRRRGADDEKELATQQVLIQSKRFYIDVKENQRGRFIKLAEVGLGGRRSRIVMSMSVANELKQRLGEFSELNASLGPAKPAAVDAKDKKPAGHSSEDGVIKSETIAKDRKRYYLDLKENDRGRFLRVSMVIPQGARAFLAIPAQGLTEFKEHLADLVDRYGVGFLDDPVQPELPESKSLRVEKKMFYFDCGSNERGTFLKVSEVRNRYRTSITVPDNFLHAFRDMLNEYVDRIGVVISTPPAAPPASAPAADAAPANPSAAADDAADSSDAKPETKFSAQ